MHPTSAVNIPGTYYYISADGNTIDQITCAVNTYGAGFKKQRACVPCPTGYTTNGVTGAISPTQCGAYRSSSTWTWCAAAACVYSRLPVPAANSFFVAYNTKKNIALTL